MTSSFKALEFDSAGSGRWRYIKARRTSAEGSQLAYNGVQLAPGRHLG